MRRRARPDGLPFRVYCRKGTRVTTWWYAHRDGTRETLATARTARPEEVAAARLVAIQKGAELGGAAPAETIFRGLVESYFRWQAEMAPNDERKKAASTLTENRREATRLVKVFGDMDPADIVPTDLYQYQDLRASAGAGAKANKELALLSAILEYGRRRGVVGVNVARGISRIPVRPRQRRVEWHELERVLEVARTLGPSMQIAALAAQAAYLTLRRPPEILSLRREQITDAGLVFVAAKRKAGEAQRTVTIAWSPALRAVVDAALAIRRPRVTAAWLPFGNLAGQRFTKSGWGTQWRKLIDKVQELHSDIERFSLLDCRPGGVSEKQERGDVDTLEATAHRDGRMIHQVYDRRRSRKATPAR